ncbi:MAG: DUF4115 domain-containing protein [Sporomusaceae bacterium]|nr:DUF4115 domain-containing protein [Sporomusaceae bacterium]
MQTIAEMLRDERQRQGLTLKDIEAVTNIRVLYLQAIEEGNYSVLPGEVYVKGFIRNYANALGLNGAEYVELYRRERQPADPEPASAAAETPQETPPAPRSAATRRRQRSRQTEIWLTGLLLLAVGGGFWWYHSSAGDAPPPAVPPPAAAPAPAAPPVAAPDAPVRPAVPAKADETAVSVTAAFSSRSWIQVTVAGKILYEGIPQPGETLAWQASQPITVKVGNAGAVELTHNNRPVGKLGGNGEVVMRTFTANGQQ